MSQLREIFWTALKLGFTSFGGPIAHLGFFRQEYVIKKQWLSESEYADLVALSQFLPGPASSQVGMGIGFRQGGFLGAFLAWLGFTLPSAIFLVCAALFFKSLNLEHYVWFIHGLKVAAVAVVAHACWGMFQKLCRTYYEKIIACGCAVFLIFYSTVWSHFAVMCVAAICGAACWGNIKTKQPSVEYSNSQLIKANVAGNGRKASYCLVGLFALLLLGLPWVQKFYASEWLAMFNTYFRVGSLVFGGGHVVLPLLKSEVVGSGWVNNDLFMAGYGISNAIPGPLFAFSAYLGAASNLGGVDSNAWIVGLYCLVAIFLPSYLMIVGLLPFWNQLRQSHRVQLAMRGLNVAVVSLLLAAFYNPVWTSAIFGFKDIMVATVAFCLLQWARWPSWGIVIACVFCFI